MSDRQNLVLGDGLNRDNYALGETVTLELNKPRPEALALPFHQLLPASHLDLLRVRLYVRKRCMHDMDFRDAIVQMCEADVIFFANIYCWVFEPRPNPRHIPVQLWPDQADLLAILKKWFGRRSLYIGKSRGIGDSWCTAILYAHALRFIPDARMCIYSKDKDSVVSDDDNSNLGKIAYILDRLPHWMTHFPDGRAAVRVSKSDAKIESLDNAAFVQGFPATDQKSRGMRFTSTWNDESNFWPGDAQKADNTAVHTCPNRIHLSTFQGTNTLFYHRMYREKTSALRVFHWFWANPARWRGAYKTEFGNVKILDTDYAYPPGYEFQTDGLLRSAYVDAVLRETGTTPSALEELYGIQDDNNLRLFRNDTLRLVNTTVMLPQREGFLRVRSPEDIAFVNQKGGPIKVWNAAVGTSTGGPYSVAADVAAGRGTGYSALTALDLRTGEQVLEFADKTIDIISFAKLCYDVLRWLGGTKGHGHAYFTFDSGGDAGQSFGEEMERLGYGNLMRRPYKLAPPPGRNHYLGYRVPPQGGFIWFVELERAVHDGSRFGTIVRSEAVLAEMHLWDKDEDDKGRLRAIYPYRADGHGDRTMALAMAHMQSAERRTAADAALESVVTISTRPDGLSHKELFSELYETAPSRRSHSSGWKLKR